MGALDFITQACDILTATTAPAIDALGVRMVIALATIMLVWFGAQEALASASGGSGFSMARFLNLFVLLSFAYMLVAFYDSAIPHVGYSLKGFVNGGAQYMVGLIGNNSAATMQAALTQAQSAVGPGIIKTAVDPYFTLVYFTVQFLLAFFAGTLSLVVGYGAIASTVVGMFGPIMIPFLAFEKLSFLFWGWLRAFIGFCFYKVVAAAVLSILSNLLSHYFLGGFVDPGQMVKQLPLLILLVLINVYMLFQVPHITMSIFSGSTGGNGGSMLAAAAVLFRL
jgi:hypothetical protein